MKNRKNAFTLVELLATIVILAIILVIVVPKVITIIEDAKKGTLESTAKMIASAAEKKKTQNLVLGKEEKITCENSVKLNDIDYQTCYIEFVDNKALVTIIGKEKFEGMFVCKGTKSDSKVVDRCPNERVNVEILLYDGIVSKNQSGIYKEGTVIDLEIPTKENSTFIEYIVVKGNSTLEGNKLTVGSEDTIIHTDYESWPTFNVELDGGNDNVEYNKNYKSGTEIELETPTKENYKFTGWVVTEGNSVVSGNKVTIGDTNTILTATWELNVFNLTIHYNDGYVSENQSGTYKVGEDINLEIPTKEGYTFSHFELVSGVESGSLNENTFTMGTSDAEIKAIYTLIEYTITYDLNGGTANNLETYTIETETFTLNNPTKENYRFIGWTGSNGTTGNVSLTIPKGSTGNRTYIANYKETLIYLYNRGNVCSDITGGWSKQNRQELGSAYGHSVSFNSDNIYFTSSWVADVHQAQGSVETNKLIDLSKYSKLEIVYTFTKVNGGVTAYFGVGTSRSSKTREIQLTTSSTEITTTLDVLDITSNNYIYVRATSGSGWGTVNVYIKEIRGIIKSPPEIKTNYPEDSEAEIGSGVTMKVGFDEDDSIEQYTYQWYKNGVAISGATSSTYELVPDTPGITNVYCKVSNLEGTTTSRTAKILVGGNWFYNRGNIYSDITGGWSKQNRQELGSAYGHSVSFNSDNIYFTSSWVADVHQAQGSVETNKLIDLSKYSKLEIVYTFTKVNSGVTAYFGIGTSRSSKTREVQLTTSSTEITTTLDVSDITSNNYIYVRATSGSGSGTVHVYIKEILGIE